MGCGVVSLSPAASPATAPNARPTPSPRTQSSTAVAIGPTRGAYPYSGLTRLKYSESPSESPRKSPSPRPNPSPLAMPLSPLSVASWRARSRLGTGGRAAMAPSTKGITATAASGKAMVQPRSSPADQRANRGCYPQRQRGRAVYESSCLACGRCPPRGQFDVGHGPAAAGLVGQPAGQRGEPAPDIARLITPRPCRAGVPRSLCTGRGVGDPLPLRPRLGPRLAHRAARPAGSLARPRHGTPLAPTSAAKALLAGSPLAQLDRRAAGREYSAPSDVPPRPRLGTARAGLLPLRRRRAASFQRESPG